MRTAPIFTGALLALGMGPAHCTELITRKILFETARSLIEPTVCRDSTLRLFGGTMEGCRKEVPGLLSACEAKLATEIPDTFTRDSENIDKYGRAYADCVLLGYGELHKDTPEAKRTLRLLKP